MRKGLTRLFMYTAFGIFAVGFIFVFMVQPGIFWGFHTEIEANIIANSISSDISVLSLSDDGKITKNFDNEWNIKIKDDKLTVSHDDSESREVSIVTDSTIGEVEFTNTKVIVLEKDGDKIKISGDSNA